MKIKNAVLEKIKDKKKEELKKQITENAKSIRGGLRFKRYEMIKFLNGELL